MKKNNNYLKNILKPDYMLYSSNLGYKGIKRFFIACDMFYSRITLHCKPEEYEFYRFDHYHYSYRKEFLLGYDLYFTFGRINPSGGKADKITQYESYRDYIQRDYLPVKPTNIKEVKEFAFRHKKILLKPTNGSLGKGIFVCDVAKDGESVLLKAILVSLDKDYIAEEYVEQHPLLADIHPQSLNTLRILTFNDDEEIRVLSASIKFGTSENVTDNLAHAGIGANIDLNTGIVNTPGYNHEGNCYLCHPESKKGIIGLKIPHFFKAIDMAKEIASLNKKHRIIGFDIAVKEDGPILIEMNYRPSPKLSQGFDEIPRGKIIKDYMRQNKDQIHPLCEAEYNKRKGLI